MTPATQLAHLRDTADQLVAFSSLVETICAGNPSAGPQKIRTAWRSVKPGVLTAVASALSTAQQAAIDELAQPDVELT